MQFIEKISKLDPSKHVFGDSRGSEENSKIKFVLPLLEYLGYDVVEDMYFEVLGADIVLRIGGKNVLVVECKSWGELLDNYKSQYLEYAYKFRTPFILASSGEHTALYSALLDPRDLHNTDSIMEFSFRDLQEEDGEVALSKLYNLISKERALGGFSLLREEIKNKLTENDRAIEQSEKEFLKVASDFKSEIKSQSITEEKFHSLAHKHSPETAEALEFLRESLYDLAGEAKNVRIRFRSKEIGIEYIDKSGPRPKTRGLFGIYPEKAGIAFGIEYGWEKLGVSEDILQEINQISKTIKDKKDVEKLVDLLHRALLEIN